MKTKIYQYKDDDYAAVIRAKSKSGALNYLKRKYPSDTFFPSQMKQLRNHVRYTHDNKGIFGIIDEVYP